MPKNEYWKNHLIVDGGGECDYSIMSCASTAPAPERWYMMHWGDFVQWGVVGKGRIVYHQHRFVVVCKLPNQSYPLHKLIPTIGAITTSPRRENCSVVSQLAIFQRAWLNSPRWQWYRVAITCHHLPSIEILKTLHNIIPLGHPF